MELERIQNIVGRFILQVPASTSKALAWIDAGLMPMQYRIYLRQAGFIYDIFKTKNYPKLLKILREQLDNPLDPWTKSWRKIEALVGNILILRKTTPSSCISTKSSSIYNEY